MPIYEYLCKHCGEKSEKIQSQPLEQITCPACGHKAEKVVSLFSSSHSDRGCTPSSGSGFG